LAVRSGEHHDSSLDFETSGPASNAEFRSVSIKGQNSGASEWSCFDGRKWKVFEKNDNGVVLYPIHDACLWIMDRVAARRSQNKHDTDGTLPKCATLEAHYEALLRLHDRNTEYPYGTDIEDEVAKITAYPSEYGSYKLEWEHQYYGASSFADGSWWAFESGWEVASCRDHAVMTSFADIRRSCSGYARSQVRLMDSLSIFLVNCTLIQNVITHHLPGSFLLNDRPIRICMLLSYYQSRSFLG